MSAARVGASEVGDEWSDWVAEQEILAEVEAELRERAADLDDAGLVALGRGLLADAGLGCGLTLEFRSPADGRLVRRVVIRPADGTA